MIAKVTSGLVLYSPSYVASMNCLICEPWTTCVPVMSASRTPCVSRLMLPTAVRAATSRTCAAANLRFIQVKTSQRPTTSPPRASTSLATLSWAAATRSRRAASRVCLVLSTSRCVTMLPRAIPFWIVTDSGSTSGITMLRVNSSGESEGEASACSSAAPIFGSITTGAAKPVLWAARASISSAVICRYSRSTRPLSLMSDPSSRSMTVSSMAYLFPDGES